VRLSGEPWSGYRLSSGRFEDTQYEFGLAGKPLVQSGIGYRCPWCAREPGWPTHSKAFVVDIQGLYLFHLFHEILRLHSHSGHL
jgi:hypothetical protein